MNLILVITVVTIALAGVDCGRRIHIRPRTTSYEEFGQRLPEPQPTILDEFARNSVDRRQQYHEIPAEYHEPPQYHQVPPEYQQTQLEYRQTRRRYHNVPQNYNQGPQEYGRRQQEYPEVTTYRPKRRRVTTQRPNYPEVTTYRPNYPEVTTYRANYPEVTTYRPNYPEITTYRPNYPEVTTYRPNYPEITTYRPPRLQSRSQVFPEPETPKVAEPVYNSKPNRANYLGKPVSDYEKMQAANAKYSFSTDIDDKINDLTNSRKEVRDGTKVTGSYSYSDGYLKRTVHYVADENGYRVTKEEAEPLDMPHVDLTGTASVNADAHGHHIAYKIQSVPVDGPVPHIITDADDA